MVCQTMCGGSPKPKTPVEYPGERGSSAPTENDSVLPAALISKNTNSATGESQDATSPPPVPPKARICLDPGHPTYPGDKLYEAIINRKVVHYLRALLVQHGFAVLVTVTDFGPHTLLEEGFDNDDPAQQARLLPLSLEDRLETCTLWKSDFLISVHHNGGLTPKRNTSFVIFGMNNTLVPWHEESRTWAEITAKHLEQTMEVSDSVALSDQEKLGFSLGMLRSPRFMSILTEAAYYTIAAERERLDDNQYLSGEAEAIFRGFLEFFESLDDTSAAQN